jgi:type III pantothenate kinase
MIGCLGAVDSGNTRTKWAVYSGEKLISHGFWLGDQPDFSSVPKNVRHWKLAGVHPHNVEATRMALESIGRKCELIASPASVGPLLDLENPEKVGIDRVASAWAAWLRMGSMRDCLIVDMGTAMTINWIDRQGVFRGGAILPGINTMLKSLSEGTKLLPRIESTDFDPNIAWPARKTSNAIMLGVIAAQTGAARQLLARAKAIVPDAALFLTGGDSRFLQDEVEGEFIRVETLVLEGIARAGEKKHG